MKNLRDALAAQGVHTLVAQFTDLHGVAKGKLMPARASWTRWSQTGAGFSGPSIAGTGLPRTGPRSEYYGRGDRGHRAAPCPGCQASRAWSATASWPDEPFDACPRQVLQAARSRRLAAAWLDAADRHRARVLPAAPDCRQRRRPSRSPSDRLDKPSYDLKSLPRQRDFLAATGRRAERACGLDVFQIDHEDAHGQYELNFLPRRRARPARTA